MTNTDMNSVVYLTHLETPARLGRRGGSGRLGEGLLVVIKGLLNPSRF